MQSPGPYLHEGASEGSTIDFAVYETDDANQLVMNSMVWIDAFNIEVIPVAGWQEGLDTLKK